MCEALKTPFRSERASHRWAVNPRPSRERVEGNEELAPSRGLWTRKLPVVETYISTEAPVLFGVLADTHLYPNSRRHGFDHVMDLFRRAEVDLLLHAGDVGDASILEALREIAPVIAVRGNADPVELIDALPDRVRIEAGPRVVLLMHGHHGKTARAAAKGAAGPGIDLIVYGHSHKPAIETEGETILFNPGSPTERRWNPHFGVGLIRVTADGIEPELVLFDDPRHLVNVTF
jgi:putative phosphoesterase